MLLFYSTKLTLQDHTTKKIFLYFCELIFQHKVSHGQKTAFYEFGQR